MSLDDLARNWNAFAASDPLWAILTWPDKRGNRWDPQAFFATGRAEVAAVLQRVRELRPALHTGRALDFGCGVGRLTLALADTFAQVDGVDIAAGMTAAARRFDPQGRARYHVHAQNDLSLFGAATFDFIYSSITLQHMSPALMRGYLREFARVLASGGVMAFQVPEVPRRAPNPNRLLHCLGVAGSRVLRRLCSIGSGAPRMDMFGMPRAEVVALLREHGCELLAVDESATAGVDWVSWLYFVGTQR